MFLKRILALPLLFSVAIIFLTRFYSLSSLPPSLFSDEVDAQYQAMFFNKFGSDYFGNLLPTHFHSFSDWRTPLSIYATALVQKLTPQLAPISSRVASAVFGTLLIFALFKLYGLFYKTPKPIFLLPLLFSPWLIHFSRTGFEVTGMLLCLTLGLYFWFKFLATRYLTHLLLSPIFLILSAYFYSTSKLFVIFIFLFFTIWFRQIIALPRHFLITLFLVLAIFSFPLAKDTYLGHAGFRFSYINIFSEPQLAKTVDYARYEDIYTSHLGQVGVAPPKTSLFFHNRPQLIWQTFYRNYISSFSTNFLLLTGDSNLRHGFSQYGYFFLIDLILIIYGLVTTLSSKTCTKTDLFFLLLLITSPVPYALTRDSLGPHATRLIIMVIPAFYFLLKSLAKVRSPYNLLLLVVYVISFIPFWNFYTHQYPQQSARTWHSNLKEAVVTAKKYTPSTFFFSNSVEPLLPFFLYYWPYLPQDGQLPTHLSTVTIPGFDGQTLDNQYYFGQINLSNFTPKAGTIIVIDSDSLKGYPNWQSKFHLVTEVNRQYLSAPDFYLISPNE
jgi:hypothetical protein